MCDEDAAVAAGECQHFRIFEASKAGSGRGPEVNFRVTAGDGADDDLVEVGVRLEADRHQRASGMWFFASASFW
jgi:hypothetical protein